MNAPLCAARCGRRLRRRTGQPGWKGAHGRCEACDRRWRNAGCPPEGPPPPVTAAERTARSTATARAAMRDRVAEYAWSRELGLSVEAAASDAGVSVKTARQAYEPALARMAARGDEAA